MTRGFDLIVWRGDLCVLLFERNILLHFTVLADHFEYVKLDQVRCINLQVFSVSIIFSTG